jgi:hypothetical protein
VLSITLMAGDVAVPLLVAVQPLQFLYGAWALIWVLYVIERPRLSRLAREAHQALKTLPAERFEIACGFRAWVPWRLYVPYSLGGMYATADVLVFVGSFRRVGAFGGRIPRTRDGIRVLRQDTTALVYKGPGLTFDEFVVKSRSHSVTVLLDKRDMATVFEHWWRLGWPVETDQVRSDRKA